LFFVFIGFPEFTAPADHEPGWLWLASNAIILSKIVRGASVAHSFRERRNPSGQRSPNGTDGIAVNYSIISPTATNINPPYLLSAQQEKGRVAWAGLKAMR
jgi:hypothetical protein